MALPSSGPLSLLDIQTEFGGSNPISLSEYYAGGGLVPAGTSGTYGAVPSSGEISVRNFYGTSNRVSIAFTYASNTQEASLNISTIPGYVSGISDVVVTINAGVYIWSDNTSVPALYLFGGTSGDVVTLINNGFIMGRGGNGGTRTTSGTPGGTALSIGRNVTINNTNGGAYIGGGGGGGGSCNSQGTAGSGGGGGAGGGAGGNGGAGGSIGNVGGNGIALSGSYYAGAGGGRIFPGVGGAGGTAAGAVASGGGAGGGGAGYRASIFVTFSTGDGGAGGSANAVGGNGVSVQSGGGAGGGGGGWGASGGNGQVANASVFIPGAGGRAVQLNGNTVTWVSGDTSRVYGAVSF